MAKSELVTPMEHYVVYRDPGYFAAWPHNGGLWQFGDGEIAVGFFRAPCDYHDRATLPHNVVDARSEQVILRSKDGGITWPLESLTTVYSRQDLDSRLKTAPVANGFISGKCYDASADGYCLLSGFGIPDRAHPHLCWTMVSQDKGMTWSLPVRLPRGHVSTNAFKFLSGRPNYLVRPDGMLLLVAFGARDSAEETLAHPIIYGSTDGGANWGIISEVELVGPKIMGIMAFPLALKDGTILLSVRRQYDSLTAYTEIYASRDGGISWRYRSRVGEWGAPATLLELPDDRVVCIYGYRRNPTGVRARFSRNRGETWGEEVVLRDDGGSFDLGYPRSILRPDGTIVTVYYFNTLSDPIQQDGGVRHIAATLWRP